MATPVCPFVPEQPGYTHTQSSPVISITLDGGRPRLRSDAIGSVGMVNCSWRLSGAEQFDSWQRFYTKETLQGALPFLIDLVTEFSLPVRHRATFVPDTVKTSGVRGLSYQVSAQLKVEPLVAELELTLFTDPNLVTVLAPNIPLDVTFQAGSQIQILGAQIDNGSDPPVDLDGIYPVTSATSTVLALTSVLAINPDWGLLSSYPGGTAGGVDCNLILSYSQF